MGVKHMLNGVKQYGKPVAALELYAVLRQELLPLVGRAYTTPIL